MKKLIKLPFQLIVVLVGLLFTAMLFVFAVPVVLLDQFLKFLKRIAENAKRLFNLSVNGYWIYF